MPPRLKLADQGEDRNLTLARFLESGSNKANADEDDLDQPDASHEVLDWPEQLSRIRRLLSSASTRERCETLNHLQGVDIADDAAKRSGLLQALTITVPRYVDQKSRSLVLEALSQLFVFNDTRKLAIQWLLLQQQQSMTAAQSPATRFNLLSWTSLLLSQSGAPLQQEEAAEQDWAKLATLFASLYASILQSPKLHSGIQRSTVQLARRTIRQQPDRIPYWVDALTVETSTDGSNALLLGVVVGVAIRLKGQFLPGGKREREGFKMIESRYDKLLAFYLANFVTVKHSAPGQSNLAAMNEFVEHFLRPSDITSKVIPQADKMLLRNPELVLSTLIHLCQRTSHTALLSELTEGKFSNSLITLSKSSNTSIRDGCLAWFSVLVDRIESARGGLRDAVCTVLSTGKATSPDHKAILLKMLATLSSPSTPGTTAEPSATAIAVVKAIQPVLAKDTNDSVLEALSEVLAIHLEPLCTSADIHPFISALTKSMTDAKANVRKTACRGVGQALWQAAVVRSKQIDSKFAQSLLPALTVNLKNAATAPLTNAAGPLEGYIAVAIARACLPLDVYETFLGSSEAMRQILAESANSKPNFLIWDKVYTKLGTPLEEEWLVRAMEATSFLESLASPVSDNITLPSIEVLVHVAYNGHSRSAIQSALAIISSAMRSRHTTLDDAMVQALGKKADEISQLTFSDDQKDDSLQRKSRLQDIVKNATIQAQDSALEEQYKSLAKYAQICHHPGLSDVNSRGTSFWIELLLSRNLDPSSVVASCLDYLLGQISGVSAGQRQISSTRTLSVLTFVSPNAVIPAILRRLEKSRVVEEFAQIAQPDIEIFETPAGELHNVAVLEQVTKTSTATASNVKGSKERALLQWEEEVRRSAALKKNASLSANGTNPTLTKAQQLVVDEQLAKEDETRKGVASLIVHVKHSLLVLRAVCESFGAEKDLYLPDLYAVARRLATPKASRLLGRSVFDAMIAIVTASLREDVTLQRPLVIASLAVAQSPALPAEFVGPQEDIDGLITRLLYRLRFLSEARPLSTCSFALVLPLLAGLIRSVAPQAHAEEGKLEQIALAVDIVSFHCGSAADISFPRMDMAQVLLHALSVFPHVAKVASTALTSLGEALSSSGTGQISEYNTLLHAAMVQHSHVRLAVLQSLQTADLTDMHFSAELFLLCHDVDERNASLAETLWLENGFKVASNFVDLLVPFLDHSTQFARHACGTCLRIGSESFPEERPNVVSMLCTLYHGRNQELRPEVDQYGLVIDSTLNREDQWQSRVAVGNALLAVVSAEDTQDADVLKVFNLLLEDGLADRSANVRESMLQVAVTIVDVHGDRLLEPLDKALRPALESSNSSNDYLTESAVVVLGRLASHMSDALSVSDIVERRLFDALSTPSESVQVAVAECLSPLIKNRPELGRALVPRLLKNSCQSAGYAQRRGSAYGLAGVIKGYGVKAFAEFGIFSTLKQNMDDKKDSNKRQGAIFVIETLILLIGRIFEPNVTQVIPILLSALGDASTDVRDAASDAARIMMRQLSGHAVKVVLPILMDALEEKQWRSKKGAIDMMGSMAYLAPRQLSQSLGEIIPQLTLVLTDTHTQVRSSGNASLKKFGEVVGNPEIQAMQNILLDALVDPSKKTVKALDKLISTTFAHFLDASSLALVIPILDRGLRERSSEMKRKSAQIVGNLATLTEGRDFVVYLTQLTPLIRSVLVDPVPEARATAAKSLGSMVERLGEDAFPGLMSALLDVLQSAATGVDQQGAAQGLAEILGGLGTDRLDDFFPDIIKQTSNTRAYVREGYMSLVVYLPSVFGDRFAPYLSRIIQPVLKGLADDSDYVRDASMRAGRMIVNSHSNRAVDLLLPELENGLFDGSWRIRQSSMQLVGELLFKLVGLTTKADAVDDVEAEEQQEKQQMEKDEAALERTTADASRKVLLEVLGKEKRDRILAAVYIVRQDPSGLVRQLSLHVWKALVNNTPRTLREILSSLIYLIVRTFSTGANEQRDTAARTLGELCRKLGDSILGEMLPILEKNDNADARTRQGTCFAYAEILENSSEEQLEGHQAQIIGAIRSALVDEDASVRAAAARAFDAVQEHLGSTAVDQTVPALLNAINDEGEAGAAALAALKEILRIRASAVLPTLIPTLTAQPITTANARALSSLMTVAGSALSKRAVHILIALAKSRDANPYLAEDNRDAITGAMHSLFAATTEPAGLSSVLMHLLGQLKDPSPTQRMRACDQFALFCEHSVADHADYDVDFMRQLISLLDDRSLEQNAVPVAASKAMSSLLKTIDKDDLEGLSPSLRRSIETIGSSTHPVAGFSIDGGLKPILPIFVQGLLTGTAEQREASAYGLGDVVLKTNPEALKPYVAQVAGPLIRIVGERVPAPVRTSILSALTIVLERIPLLVRPFYPQIQRTFAKNLGDVSSLAVRNRSATGLGVLMAHQPRVDPLVTELLNNLNGADDGDLKDSYASALAKVLEAGGKNTTSPIRANVSTFLQESYTQGPSKESWSYALARVLAALAKNDEALARPLIELYVFNTTPSTALSSISLRVLVEDAGDVLLAVSPQKDSGLIVNRILNDAAQPDNPSLSRPAKEAKELLRSCEPFASVDEVQSRL